MKLVYFNGRGLAETSRLILAFKNIKYEDFRYPLKIIDWATYNMEKKEFEDDKNNNKLSKSLNKLPYLIDDNIIIPQSKAIERYLARKYDLFGIDNIEAARIDSICEYVRDFKELYQGVRKLKGSEKEDVMKKWFSETLPERLHLLEVILCGEHELYAVGLKESLADIVLFSFITQFFDDNKSVKLAVESCPKIQKIVGNIEINKSVKEWLNKRPSTSF